MDTLLYIVSLPGLLTNRVYLTYLVRHSLPLSISTPVFRDIVKLREDKQSNRNDVDDDQVPITSPIQRLVILAIDV